MVKDSIQIGKEVMEETDRAFEKAFPNDKIIRKLDQLLEATKPISCIKGKDAGSGTVDFVDVPDNQAQLKALDMVLDVRGVRAAQKVSVQLGVEDILRQLDSKPAVRNSDRRVEVIEHKDVAEMHKTVSNSELSTEVRKSVRKKGKKKVA